MRLVVDANILVSEALRVRGRALLSHPALDLFIAAEMFSEAIHEVRRRSALIAARRQLAAESLDRLLLESIQGVQSAVTMVPSAGYAGFLEEALERIPRDPDDAPTLALTLLLDCGIWTLDRDFFGCGVAVWSSEILQSYLLRTG